MKTQGEGCHLHAKETGLEQLLPSWPSEGTDPANSWLLHFPPPEQGHKTFLLLELPSLWHSVTAAPANTPQKHQVDPRDDSLTVLQRCILFSAASRQHLSATLTSGQLWRNMDVLRIQVIHANYSHLETTEIQKEN